VEIGDFSLIIQVVILFMLVLGLPLSKGGPVNSKSLLRHGYLTAFALALHTVLVIVVMIILAFGGYAEIFSLPLLSLTLSLSHMVLGFVAIAMGYVVVAFWLSKPLSNMGCYRARKIMMPLLVVWAVSLVLGAIVHLFEFF
jgi:hypothetical protein